MFQGRRFDPETGLYYYRNRMMSADLGRFLQTDPLGYVDGYNLYEFVGNSSINSIDALGLEGKYLNTKHVDKKFAQKMEKLLKTTREINKAKNLGLKTYKGYSILQDIVKAYKGDPKAASRLRNITMKKAKKELSKLIEKTGGKTVGFGASLVINKAMFDIQLAYEITEAAKRIIPPVKACQICIGEALPCDKKNKSWRSSEAITYLSTILWPGAFGFRDYHPACKIDCTGAIYATTLTNEGTDVWVNCEN